MDLVPEVSVQIANSRSRGIQWENIFQAEVKTYKEITRCELAKLEILDGVKGRGTAISSF